MNIRLQRMALSIATALAIWWSFNSLVRAQELVSLLDVQNPSRGWSVSNGQEFPGAKADLTTDADSPRGNRKSLRLVGDFTGGGAYVAAGRKFEPVDVRELSFW